MAGEGADQHRIGWGESGLVTLRGRSLYVHSGLTRGPEAPQGRKRAFGKCGKLRVLMQFHGVWWYKLQITGSARI